MEVTWNKWRETLLVHCTCSCSICSSISSSISISKLPEGCCPQLTLHSTHLKTTHVLFKAVSLGFNQSWTCNDTSHWQSSIWTVSQWPGSHFIHSRLTRPIEIFDTSVMALKSSAYMYHLHESGTKWIQCCIILGTLRTIHVTAGCIQCFLSQCLQISFPSSGPWFGLECTPPELTHTQFSPVT